jgi:hypothetical protein
MGRPRLDGWHDNLVDNRWRSTRTTPDIGHTDRLHDLRH